MRVRAAQVHRGENSWRGTWWGVGPAYAAVSAALPPQVRSEVKSHVGPVLTSRAEGGGGFLRTGPLPSCGSCQKLQLMVISRFFHWNHGLVKNRAKGTRDAF